MTRFSIAPLYPHPVRKAGLNLALLGFVMGIGEKISGFLSEAFGLTAPLELAFLIFVSGAFLVVLSKEKVESTITREARYDALKGGLIVFGGTAIALGITGIIDQGEYPIVPLYLLTGYLVVYTGIFYGRLYLSSGTEQNDPDLMENIRSHKRSYLAYGVFLVLAMTVFWILL